MLLSDAECVLPLGEGGWALVGKARGEGASGALVHRPLHRLDVVLVVGEVRDAQLARAVRKHRGALGVATGPQLPFTHRRLLDVLRQVKEG